VTCCQVHAFLILTGKRSLAGRYVNSMCLILHEPNVHVGGGIVLLLEQLAACKGRLESVQLDERTRGRFEY